MFDDGASAANFTLFAVHRVGQSSLIRGFGDPDPLGADTQTRVVHHGKHRSHATVFGADQPATRTFIAHYSSWRTVKTEFVFKAHNAQVIAFTQSAVRVRDEFGNDKEADAFGARNTIGQAGQNKVADVFAEITITPSDVDFLPRDRKAAVAQRFRFG